MTAFFSVSFGRGSVFGLCDWPRPLNVILFTWSSSASWQRLSMSSGSNGLHWGAISQQAGWVFSHGVLSKAPANARPPSFPKFIRAHDIMARPPIRLASVLLLQLFSHPLTALKKKDTSTCLLWKSLWPHINARPQLSDGRRGRAIRPSHTEPHLHSLDAPTWRLDKRLQRFTWWLCSRSSVQDARHWGSRSGFSLSQGPEELDRPGSKCHQSHRPSHRAFNVQPYSVGAPPLAHDDRDERGGQSSFPRRSDLLRQPVWTSCGGLCWTLHRGSEVVSGDATLPP